MNPGNKAFKQVIHFLEKNKFWETVFEKQLLFSNETGIKFDFNLERFEELLWSHEQQLEEKITVNLKGNTIPYNRNAAGKDRFRWLMDQYNEGCTIIINSIDEIDPQAAILARSLDTVFRGRTTINAFLTPANSRGFLPHFDTHDVFILQTAGTKEWMLYPKEMELPLDRQIYLIDQDKTGEPVTTFQLEKNSLLYIPRGMVHGAKTKDSYSLHLTIGVRPLLKIDFLKAMLDVISEEDPFFRQSNIGEDLIDTSDLLKKLAVFVNDPYIITKTNTAIDLKNLTKIKPLQGHHFRNFEEVNKLNIDAKIEKAFPGEGIIESHLGNIRLYYPGVGLTGNDDAIQQGYIEYDALAYGALTFINKQESTFKVKDMPDIYPDKLKLSIVKTLIQEGFLKFG